MKPNTSPQGVAYGYVAANDLHPELVDDLLYGYGPGVTQWRDLSYHAARKEAEARARSEWEDELEAKSVAAQEEGIDIVHDDFDQVAFDEAFDENFECDERQIEGIKDGVTYVSSWLGGALNFFITASPFITTTAHRASPCVPNAGILKHPAERDGDVTSYDVHPEWWDDRGHNNWTPGDLG